MIVSINGRNSANLYIGGLVGFFGSLFASIFLTIEKYIYYANTMPMNANPDIPASLYANTLFNLAKLSPVSSLNSLLYIFISTILCAMFTQFELIKWARKAAGSICVIILALNFLFVSVFSSQGLLQYASSEPPNLSYAYDAVVYMKTIYRMQDKGFYKAHVEAQYNDARRNKQGDWTEKGAQPGTSRLWIRHPFIFYLWKYVSYGGSAARVVYLSILLCATLIVMSYYVAKNKLSVKYSLLAPIFITPYLFVGTTWVNIFFPDWWAGLFLFAALMFWVLQKNWVSSLILLLALLSREVTATAFIIFFVLSFFKDRNALKPLLFSGTIFAVLYTLHYFNASQAIMEGKASSISASTFTSLYAFRLMPTISYMMFMYGFFKIPIIILSVLSLLSSIFYRRLDLSLFVSYSLVHNSLASSSYWGSHFMLIILFSLVFLFSPKLRIRLTS